MISVTLKYGLTREVRTEVEDGTTIRTVLSNTGYRATLGLPEKVSAVIDGTTVGLDETLADGDVVVFERQAAEKAA